MPSDIDVPKDADPLKPSPDLRSLLEAFDSERHGGEAMDWVSVGREFPAPEGVDATGLPSDGRSGNGEESDGLSANPLAPDDTSGKPGSISG